MYLFIKIFVLNLSIINSFNPLKIITMTRTKGRIVISQNPKENLELAQRIYNKHVELGAASPLNTLDDVDWSVTGPKVPPTLVFHTEAEFHKGESEKNYRDRDKTMPEIVEATKMSIGLLKASFGKNPKKLADWGVSVDDTPKAKKPTKPKP